jgi:hypothetical protein
MGWDLEVIDALAQLSNTGGYFRHISASARSAWVGNDKPFLAAAEKKAAGLHTAPVSRILPQNRCG